MWCAAAVVLALSAPSGPPNQRPPLLDDLSAAPLPATPPAPAPAPPPLSPVVVDGAIGGLVLAALPFLSLTAGTALVGMTVTNNLLGVRLFSFATSSEVGNLGVAFGLPGLLTLGLLGPVGVMLGAGLAASDDGLPCYAPMPGAVPGLVVGALGMAVMFLGPGLVQSGRGGVLVAFPVGMTMIVLATPVALAGVAAQEYWDDVVPSGRPLARR